MHVWCHRLGYNYWRLQWLQWCQEKEKKANKLRTKIRPRPYLLVRIDTLSFPLVWPLWPYSLSSCMYVWPYSLPLIRHVWPYSYTQLQVSVKLPSSGVNNNVLEAPRQVCSRLTAFVQILTGYSWRWKQTPLRQTTLPYSLLYCAAPETISCRSRRKLLGYLEHDWSLCISVMDLL